VAINGRINVIISGKHNKRSSYLNTSLRKRLRLLLSYGHHIGKESIMTYYIENMDSKSYTFVDGSWWLHGGGDAVKGQAQVAVLRRKD
jgi:hypothetical protein